MLRERTCSSTCYLPGDGMSWRKSLATSKNSEKRAFLLALVALIVLYAIFWFRSYSSYAQGNGDSAHSAPPPSGLSRVLRVWAPARYQPMACIGVQTSFNYYAFRRADLRQTWFPADEAAMQRLEEQGIIMRFVVGQTSNAEHELALQQEIEEFGPFLRLPINDTYKTLPWKTHAFVVTAFRLYNPKFVVKVDDDVYLRLDRLRLALTQYEERRFGFIGCMRRGHIESDPGDLNYEPDNAVVGGKEYHTFASGPLYILENSAAKMLSGIDPTWLRHLANEDTMMGAWMLSLNVKHFDDRRLCTRQCLSITIGTAPTHVTGRPTVSSYHANCSLSSTLPSGFDNLPLLPPTIKFAPNDTDGLTVVHGPQRSQLFPFSQLAGRRYDSRPRSAGQWRYVASRPRLQYGSAQGAAGGDEPEEALSVKETQYESEAAQPVMSGRYNGVQRVAEYSGRGRVAPILSRAKNMAARQNVLKLAQVRKARVEAEEGGVGVEGSEKDGLNAHFFN